MMAAKLQDLLARLKLDTAQFGKGLQNAKGQTQTFAASIRSILAPVAGALASGLSVGAIAGAARLGAQEIDRVAKSARALSGSVAGVKAVELAMSEAGVQAEVMRTQFQNMERQIASGRADVAMRALGLAASDLAGLDVDEKVALISDRVADLGLDTGSTLAVLRQFGIENRDMALLMMQGGDAVRGARRDIEDYGLSLSSIDTARIEAANDQIGRLSLIGQYLRQELALSITPALGEFARAMTESLREGGLLRGMIDGLVSLIPRLTAYVATAAGGAIAYGVGLGTVAAAKWAVAAAAKGLRAALMRLGLPILILAAGEMVYQFRQLVDATGGWGEALDALGALASDVWSGITLSAQAIEPALAAVWKDIQAGFFSMLESMSAGFADFMSNFTALAALPEWGVTAPFKALGDAAVASTSLVDGFSTSARGAAAAADQLRSQAGQLASAGFGQAREALDRLREIMAKSKDEGDEFNGTIREIYNSLNDVAGEGGGGAPAAANALRGLKSELDKIAPGARQVESSFESSFVNAVTNIRNARQEVAGLAMDLARMAAQSAFRSLFGGSKLFGGIASFFNVGQNANGTDNWRGGLTLLGERGAELVNLPRGSQVFDAQESARMLRGGGGGSHVLISLGQGLVGDILSQAEGQTVQIVREYDRGLPGRVADISRDPRRR
jgi:hypothetical protein